MRSSLVSRIVIACALTPNWLAKRRTAASSNTSSRCRLNYTGDIVFQLLHANGDIEPVRDLLNIDGHAIAALSQNPPRCFSGDVSIRSSFFVKLLAQELSSLGRNFPGDTFNAHRDGFCVFNLSILW
jgi:hypothetical protein